MSFAWTIAEQFEGTLKPVSFELLGWGRKLTDKLGTKLASVVTGDGVGQDTMQSLIRHGTDEVYSIQGPRLGGFRLRELWQGARRPREDLPKILYHPKTKAILGASIVGAGATDTIHELLLAARAELTLGEVAETVHAYPTLSEGIMEACKASLERALHADRLHDLLL
jgi:electron transfer flavoprotein alpha subunit